MGASCDSLSVHAVFDKTTKNCPPPGFQLPDAGFLGTRASRPQVGRSPAIWQCGLDARVPRRRRSRVRTSAWFRLCRVGQSSRIHRVGTAMKLDFLLCGSANDAFFSQIAFFALCLNKLGGMYADARVAAVFGDYEVAEVPRRWRKYFKRIEVYWGASSSTSFPRGLYLGRHYRRFEIMRTDADLVFLCDADIAPVNRFDGLIAALTREPALAGTIAYHHLAYEDGQGVHRAADWSQISRSTIGKNLERPYRYTFDPSRNAPFYVNYGLFAGTPCLLKKFYARALQLQPQVCDITNNCWHSAQVVVPLVCADLGLPTLALPLRFNCPNDERPEKFHPEEIKHLKFIHYMKTREFDRHELFTNETSFNDFIGKEMNGINEMFRRHVYDVTKGLYPFRPPPKRMRLLREIARVFRHS